MKTKPLTFLFALTFLFMFSGSSVVFADDLQDAKEATFKGDFKKAHKLLLPLAEQGNVTAQYNLGVMYEAGEGVAQDDKESAKWYRLAAEQGHPKAQNNLGGMYRDGQGVPKDYKEAIRWYRLSAEQGHSSAQGNLGSIYENGVVGVPQDYKEAIKWWKLAAEQGMVLAQVKLGEIYVEGTGVPQNFKEAEKWWRLAAEQGVAQAQFNLGLMYAKGKGVPEDLNEAVKWFRLAAEQGNAEAREVLDLISREIAQRKNQDNSQDSESSRPKGIEDVLGKILNALNDALNRKDYKKAYKLLVPLAESGNARSQFMMGWMHANGHGVGQDYKEAAKWFRLAAEQGDAQAQTELGTLYANGLGVLKDIEEVEKWWKLAAEQGVLEAQNRLEAFKNIEAFKNKNVPCTNFDKSLLNNKRTYINGRALSPKGDFALSFVPNSLKESDLGVWLEDLASNKKTLIANFEVRSRMDLCGSIGCRDWALLEDKVIFSEDSSIVAFSSESSFEVFVFETRSWKKLLETGYADFALSADGKKLVVGGHSWKFGWRLSMYRLDTKTKEALSGMDFDVDEEFGNRRHTIGTIEAPEEWYEGQEFTFSKNGEYLILTKKWMKHDGYAGFYKFQTKKINECMVLEAPSNTNG